MRGVISMAEFIKVDALGDACPLPVLSLIHI